MASLPDPLGTLTPEAKRVYDKITAKRGAVRGPFASLMHHPALAERVGDLGEFLRFGGTLPGDIPELAILITARSVNQAYEWVAHARIARKEGLADDVIERVRTRGDLAALPPRYARPARGFDAAFTGLEHASFDLRDVPLMVLAAERVGITPIVRTPRFDPAFILRLLDMGVQGIQLPHSGDARAAREAVKAVRYAPVGERGMAGASRASDYGKIAVKEHIERSNREITLAVMIEDLPALEEIDAIASTDGIDIVAVGPSDMSRALGVSGTADHPKLVEVVQKVAASVRKAGIARLALPMNDPTLPRNAA